jgi:hypothetical protein
MLVSQCFLLFLNNNEGIDMPNCKQCRKETLESNLSDWGVCEACTNSSKPNQIELVQVGEVEAKYTSAGNWSGYMIKLYHEGLEETRHLSAREDSVLEGKVNNQINAWNKKWERQEAIQDKKNKD